MRKSLTIATLFVLATTLSYSQSGSKTKTNSLGQNSFIAEGGGPGIAFSANIDRRFKPGRLGFGGRIGLGFVSAYDDNYDPVSNIYYGGDLKSAITTPVQLNYIFGKESSPHTFEIGAGLTYVTKKLNIMNFDFYGNNDKRSQLFGTFCFMYRRQPVNGGFSWRAGLTPIASSDYIQMFAGASIGYNF